MKFYDIHCHAFNLSHPNLSAFIKRFILETVSKYIIHAWIFVIILGAALCWSPEIRSILVFFLIVLFLLIVVIWSLFLLNPDKTGRSLFHLLVKLLKRPFNLLALMENDLGSYFLLVEEYLSNPRNPYHPKAVVFRDGKLEIGNVVYEKIVLTPLMMDFGDKNIISNNLPYGSKLISKPIAQQVTDVFNGIRRYRQKSPYNILEIYPFLGINTKNYKLTEIQQLLDKYFKDYKGNRNDLYEKMGQFDGNVDKMTSNFFAGIKVYPPLGFDPWPDNEPDELQSVECLYQYCCEKRIPITTHCSEGGFIVGSASAARIRTSPERWIKVLQKYSELKINFAHFGRQDRTWYGAEKHDWEKIILDLLSYDNVYTDFSYRGCDDDYYEDLKNLVDNNDKLKQKILFGSDFMINLLDIDSYNDYLRKFIDAPVEAADKALFCSVNPDRFLFG